MRLKYRYLDLRRQILQQNIATRSKALSIIKNYFTSRDFLEIETPTLFKSTPEGAREFLVPTRQYVQHCCLCIADEANFMH